MEAGDDHFKCICVEKFWAADADLAARVKEPHDIGHEGISLWRLWKNV